LFRAFPFLLAAATALAGCMPGSDASFVPRPSPVAQLPPIVSRRKVAVLLPLTGPNAALGQDLLRAVQLALGPSGPQADVQDTGGTPTGATAAAQAAIAAQDAVIVGPLTAQETAAAAAVAAGTPILAFTSDRQQGRPGVWALGITPQQQVARLVQALQTEGKSRIAAALPDNSFGEALADGLTRATAAAGDPPPVIKRYPTGRLTALDAALRDVTDYANRRGAVDAQVAIARQSTDPDVQSQAATLAQQPVQPPPIDALMLAESGAALRTVAAVLPGYDVKPPDVRVVGPATWARDATNLGGLAGAWYAAPDPAARTSFERDFAGKYGTPPPGLADIAYDAAQIAAASLGDPLVLTRRGGFRGVDGPIALQPDGQVLRGLAVFELGNGGAHIVEPAPFSLPSGS
jgi:ABC-type branched-subunit amino acid transport system substrate-binding protein